LPALTADRSTTELRWIVFALELRAVYIAHTPLRGKLYFNPIKIDVGKQKPCLDYLDGSAQFWRNISVTRLNRARATNTNKLS